jgi:hypothetical protein
MKVTLEIQWNALDDASMAVNFNEFILEDSLNLLAFAHCLSFPFSTVDYQKDEEVPAFGVGHGIDLLVRSPKNTFLLYCCIEFNNASTAFCQSVVMLDIGKCVILLLL